MVYGVKSIASTVGLCTSSALLLLVPSMYSLMIKSSHNPASPHCRMFTSKKLLLKLSHPYAAALYTHDPAATVLSTKLSW